MKSKKTYLLLSIVVVAIFFSFCFSAYGFEDCFWLEDEFGYWHLYCDVKWADWDIPVKYYINPLNGAPTGFSSPIQSACDTWNEVCCSYFKFKYMGTTTRKGAKDGYNVWWWNSTGTGMGNAALAATSTWFDPSTEIIEDCDTEFNGQVCWSTSGSLSCYDIENVAAHEAGHWLLLCDLYDYYDSEATMYYNAAKGETKKRTLDQDDINGICHLYPYSLTVTSPYQGQQWKAGVNGQ